MLLALSQSSPDALHSNPSPGSLLPTLAPVDPTPGRPMAVLAKKKGARTFQMLVLSNSITKVKAILRLDVDRTFKKGFTRREAK